MSGKAGSGRARPGTAGTAALSPALAFAVAVAGIASFSGVDAVMKGLSLALGTYVALLWRTAATIPISGVLWLARGPRWPSRVAMRIHFVRAVLGALTAFLFFWGLERLPMAQTIALTHIAPLMALVLAAVVLKEKLRRRTVLASVLAMVGVAVILVGQARTAPGPDATWGALAVLGSAIGYSYNIILMRQQALLSEPLEIAFFQSVFITAALLPAAYWFGGWPGMEHVPAILLGAALAVVSLALLGWAYGHAEASFLAASEYTAFLWASLFGYFFFGESVSSHTLAGAVLIIGACLWGTRVGRDRRGARPDSPGEQEEPC